MVAKKEARENEKVVDKKADYLGKARENPWIVSTVVLGAVLILVLAFGGLGDSGSKVSADEAGAKLVEFLNSQPIQGEVELVSSEADGQFYKVTLSYQDQEIPAYTTLDGEFYVTGLYPLNTVEESETETSEPQPTEVPKLDRPSADLYIWSYCPYGVTALSPFSDVASLLGDSADFKVHLYYAGHGDFEVQQNKIQACIQDLGSESYWEYAKTFANEIYEKCYGDVNCDMEESVALMNSLGIDSDAVLSCVESNGDTLLEEHYNSAKGVGVTGSPSLVVNGVKVSVARTAEAFKGAVCSGFNEVPESCSEVLSDAAGTTTGSC